MTGYYAQNPHYAPADLSEDRERQERAEAEAGRLFSSLTIAQTAQHAETMDIIRAYRNTPRWDREKAAADFIWKQTTAEASKIYEMALRDLLATGEISEATYAAADDLDARQTMLEAAE